MSKRDLAKEIKAAAPHGVRYFHAYIVSAGRGNTSGRPNYPWMDINVGGSYVTQALVGGTTYSNVPVLDQVATSYSAGGTGTVLGVAWVADLGDGKWLVIGTQSVKWNDITFADANWSWAVTPRWRIEGRRVYLAGYGTRQQVIVDASAYQSIFNLGGSNPPAPTSLRVLSGHGFHNSTHFTFLYTVESTTKFRLSTNSPDLPGGASIYLDGLSWDL